LSFLLDRAFPRPTDEVLKVIQEDLGDRKITDVFESINAFPIAAASLAQVHKATLKDGREAVVKARVLYGCCVFLVCVYWRFHCMLCLLGFMIII